jgi:hypothetical protein
MSRAVMQQALDALVECRHATTDKSERMADAAIEVLRRSLVLPWWATERGRCSRESHCQCGGDVPAVREGCSSWAKRPGINAYP